MRGRRRTGLTADAHRPRASPARGHETETGDFECADAASSKTSSAQTRFIDCANVRRRDQSPSRIPRPLPSPARRRSRALRRSSDPRGRAVGSLARQLRSVQRGRAERMQLVADRPDRVHQRLPPRDVERRPRRRSLREHEEPDREGSVVRLLHGTGRRRVVGPRLPLITLLSRPILPA